MTYPEAIQYLESFINYEKVPFYPYKESLKLERINDFLETIGNPQNSLKCIHVAGTKGKGSTCVFLTYILRQAEYKTGLYTSPHLSDFRERIRILKPTTENGSTRSPFLEPSRAKSRGRYPKTDFEGMISKNEMVDLVERLRPAIERYNKSSKYGPLSFFEVYTALAFVYFKEKKVDFAVLETGLGGRLDATNVVNPLVCAITPISYEHTQKLGSTLREIATEKAGIIKSHKVTKSQSHQLIVISAPQEKEAAEVIRNRCKKAGAKLYEVGRNINFRVQGSGFKVQGLRGKYANLRIRLLGSHQLINATVAVGVIEALRFYNINIGIDSISRGLYNTLWPGRCEIIAKNPFVVLDGAQNVASACALKKAVKENFKYKRLILVLGISKDKDIKGICQELCPLSDEIILTRADNPRAARVEDIEKIILSHVAKTRNVKEALALAKGIANKEALILVTGSLFLVGEARELFAQGRL